MKLVKELLLLSIIQMVVGDRVLDHWLYDNNMGHLTEHLHDKMQHHRARGERIRLRVE